MLAAPLNPPPQAPPGLDALATQIIGWLKWGALVAGTLGLLLCIGMIVIGRRRRGGLAQEGLLGSVWVLVPRQERFATFLAGPSRPLPALSVSPSTPGTRAFLRLGSDQLDLAINAPTFPDTALGGLALASSAALVVGTVASVASVGSP